MGDERGCGIDVLARVISIHAPPRGATPPTFTPEAEKLRISIHAPPRGATAVAARFKQRYISIHAPPRGATRLYGEREVELHISIHAPPRGATRRSCPRTRKPTLFQFTPLREGRLCTLISTPAVFLFQFTPLREGRHDGERVRFAAWRYFNSRPSARGDARTGVDLTLMHFISIHAPPRGATQWRTQTGRKLSFQFTPLREGRRACTSGLVFPHLFQFTPLREGRRNGLR